MKSVEQELAEIAEEEQGSSVFAPCVPFRGPCSLRRLFCSVCPFIVIRPSRRRRQ